MKITNLIGTTNIYNKKITNNKTIEKNNKKSDTFTVSDKAKDFQTVLKAVQLSPDLREEKINEIANKIQNNSYNVSAEDVANKILKNI